MKEMNNLQTLIEISRYYAEKPGYVIAGGGNTSFKEKETIWIKASGIPLAGIGHDGFVSLSRPMLDTLALKSYSDDPLLREEQVKQDIKKAVLSPENLRPSVETSLHNLIPYTYVVHTHPTLVNALMCAMDAATEVEKRFGKEVLYMEYTDPGYILFKALQERIASYLSREGRAPKVIFLQNHGIFVGADSTDEIIELYREIEQRISDRLEQELPVCDPEEYQSEATRQAETYFRSRSLILKAVRCPLISHFVATPESYSRISKPFTPDIIVYCKSNYLFLDRGLKGEEVVERISAFESSFSYYPKVILEEEGGLMVVEEDPSSLNTVLEVYLDLMKISYLSWSFGGPHFMTPEQISFIDSWEVENYRRKMAKSKGN